MKREGRADEACAAQTACLIRARANTGDMAGAKAAFERFCELRGFALAAANR